MFCLCVYVPHGAWCLGSSEEGTRCPGTGLINGCESLGTEPGSSARTVMALNHSLTHLSSHTVKIFKKIFLGKCWELIF